MILTNAIRGVSAAAALLVAIVACAADDVIININQDSGDSIDFNY